MNIVHTIKAVSFLHLFIIFIILVVLRLMKYFMEINSSTQQLMNQEVGGSFIHNKILLACCRSVRNTYQTYFILKFCLIIRNIIISLINCQFRVPVIETLKEERKICLSNLQAQRLLPLQTMPKKTISTTNLKSKQKNKSKNLNYKQHLKMRRKQLMTKFLASVKVAFIFFYFALIK